VSDFQVHSFDPLRDRAAPRLLRGRALDGRELLLAVERPTLVVAIKPECDGCRPFVNGELAALAAVEVVVASAVASDEWRVAKQSVWVSPELLEALCITAPPFYVLIDATSARVIAEGAVFSPEQVAAEIRPFVTA